MKHSIITYCFILVLFCISCTASDVGSATKDEALKMKIKEQRNVIDPKKLPSQEALTMNERHDRDAGAGRGLLTPIAGSLVSLATDGVKKVIANNRKKYFANYQFGLTDLYFYDQLSPEGPFDPVGLQFSGFKLIRTFANKTGVNDTALVADFALDTLNSSEMINNSIFRLRLKEFDLRYAKAKISKFNKKKLNMDFEITFLTSYVNRDGLLFDSVVLGKFYLLIRDAPLDRSDTSYNAYYSNLKDTLLAGKSFIIPRSFGYHRESDGTIKEGFSQGAYSIQVNVKESSKDHFVNKLIIENANIMLDATRDRLKSKLKK